ncbi:MAG TPA: hypothetical protein VNL98_02885 [Gemmatimonadales bacterium]|nr:hypothetical protein [Gemmatimonadales bacterium]
MSRSDERKMQALVRKLSKQSEQQRHKDHKRRKYDETLVTELDDDTERQAFFSEMKKREF